MQHGLNTCSCSHRIGLGDWFPNRHHIRATVLVSSPPSKDGSLLAWMCKPISRLLGYIRQPTPVIMVVAYQSRLNIQVLTVLGTFVCWFSSFLGACNKVRSTVRVVRIPCAEVLRKQRQLGGTAHRSLLGGPGLDSNVSDQR